MKNKSSPLKSFVKKTAQQLGYKITRVQSDQEKAREIANQVTKIPDEDLYCPTFSPWLGKKFQTYCLPSLPLTLVSADRLWVLHSLARQVMSRPGDFVECGVYKGGTALLFAKTMADHGGPAGKTLHLFDTFEGMPEVNAEKDTHRKGDFSDTNLEAVRGRLAPFPRVAFHPGTVPGTFRDLPAMQVCFAHVDVDIYDSVFSCCEYLYPRLTAGGIMIFDDYGFSSCPGARAAVDQWFADKAEVPLVLATGQAVVCKLPAAEPTTARSAKP
jgi:O-methyltransferase